MLPEMIDGDELIVVDDHSSDGSVEEIRSWNIQRATIIELDENRGHINAFSVAASHATNNIIVFADQDDLWVAGRLEVLCRPFVGLEKPQLAYGDFAFFSDGETDVSNLGLDVPFPHFEGNTRFIWLLLSGQSRLYGCCTAINRSLLEVALPFPESIDSHDLWLAYCAALIGVVVPNNTIVTRRRIHSNNLSRSRRKLPAILLARTRIVIKVIWRLRHESRKRFRDSARL